MKTLFITAAILGIGFVYFVAASPRAIIAKGGEVLPAGVDIAKFVSDKAGELKNIIGGASPSSALNKENLNILPAVNNLKSGVENILGNISDSITHPIRNKIGNIICPSGK